LIVFLFFIYIYFYYLLFFFIIVIFINIVKLKSSDREKPVINVYDGKGDGSILYTIDNIHSQPVSIIEYNPVDDVVVSVDDGGMIEYWQPDPDENFAQPKPPAIAWTYKSDTDLYTFKKVRKRF